MATTVPSVIDGDDLTEEFTLAVKAAVDELQTRRGGSWRRAANQSIGSGAIAAITWDTEDTDTDGYLALPSTTFTVPTGLGGIYVVTFDVFASTGLSGGGNVYFTIGGANRTAAIINNGTSGTVTWSGPLAATVSVTANVYNGHSGSVNFTGSLYAYRVSL
jgi:hypothetical protein